MAVAFVSLVIQNLNSLIQKEVGLLWEVDEEMNKLSSTFSTIRAVLEDAELKQLQDKATQNWLRKLKDAAYELDDILDECTTEALRRESEGKKFKFSKEGKHFFGLSCMNIPFRHKIGNRMKEITKHLDAIAEERMKFHLREAVVQKRVELSEWRETCSAPPPQLYGREEDKERIVKMLVNDVSDCHEVSVYPIIGMGGLGKTTLAQMVFSDETVKFHFEPKSWVYVSQDFNVKRMIKAIIESISGNTCDASDLDSLQKKLQEMLNGKRYLLVLDDMWDEDQEKWDILKCVLACGSKGASIIITTRVEKVASIVRTLPPHHLSFLSEDDCWLLFKQRAFGHGNEESPKLVAIGKEIVKKCGGVPLAAKALGGLLRFKSEEKEWLSIKESELWNIPQNESSILSALRLSYYNLPLELRNCFGYCAVFLKGSKIEKEDLIQLWMANGFISSNGILEVEDIGNGIWNELYWRSFFQNEEKDGQGKITFKMHDLMHDLAQFVMQDECHMMEAQSSSNISNQRIRHVTLVAEFVHENVFPKALHRVRSVRTVLQQFKEPNSFCASEVHKVSCDFTNFCSLRVFDGRGFIMRQLSSSIGNLKHLSCRKLQRLPKNIKNLRSLRHLYLKWCRSIQSMPPKLGRLTLLKTLSRFVVGKSRGHRLAELQHLDLGGELIIKNLERVRNSTDAKEANLVGKQNLRILGFSWDGLESQANVEQILEALEPHSNVEELLIFHYRGSQFPLWMRDSILKNVVHIQLYDCRNCLLLPAFGQLPSLRSLALGRMDVEYIDNDFPGGGPVQGFPCLEELHIDSLLNLKGLSREEGRELLPRLRKISISNCPKLTLPHLSSLESLVVRRCNNVVLSSISSLVSLRLLSIRSSHELESLPDHALPCLKSLQHLRIDHCNNLSSLSEGLGHLTALEKLEVEGCPKLVALPESIKHLNSLQHLIISGRPTGWISVDPIIPPELKTLPEALQHVPALQSLVIREYLELTSLPEWLGNLTSLQSLTICGCPKILSLPSSIQSLTKLQTLTMWDCAPELRRRCEKGKGEDWYKIAHIPEVYGP